MNRNEVYPARTTFIISSTFQCASTTVRYAGGEVAGAEVAGSHFCASAKHMHLGEALSVKYVVDTFLTEQALRSISLDRFSESSGNDCMI